MACAKDLKPGEKPLDIEMAFGDPEAIEKAVENMATYPYCIEKDLHCPWIERCSSDPAWQCPIDLQERSRINDNPRAGENGNS